MLIGYWKARIEMALKFFVENEDKRAAKKFEEHQAQHPEDEVPYDINYIRSKDCSLPQYRKDDVLRIHELLRVSQDSSEKELCKSFCKSVRNAVTIEVHRTLSWWALYWAIGDGRCCNIHYTPYEPRDNLLIYLVNVALLINESDQLLGGLYTKRCEIKGNKIVIKHKTIEELAQVISNQGEEEAEEDAELNDINLGINPHSFLAADTIKEMNSLVSPPLSVDLWSFDRGSKHYKF